MPAVMDQVTMRARPVKIDWHTGMSIYASETFLKLVGDEYGWLGGTDGSGKLRCILPYTVVRKAIFRMVRFRLETIPVGEELDLEEEKAFLNSAVAYLRSTGADLIIPASTNAIFRTYPDGAIAAPYGSYVLDLTEDEDTLWNGLSDTYRKNIRKSSRMSVRIQSGIERLDEAYALVRSTFKRSSLPFMGQGEFKRLVFGLGENVKLLIADHQGIAQSCTVFPFSSYCAYAVYGGSIPQPVTGAMKLVQWQAIRQFRDLGVKRFDLVGGRINPAKGSKAEGIVAFKQHFGAQLVSGYIWKFCYRPLKYYLYSLAVRLQRRGDIVDQERHKLNN